MKKMVWLVTAKSGLHHGNCVLGVGSSKQDAISDATGGDTRLMRGQYAVQMTEDEAISLYPSEESRISEKAV